MNIEKIVGCRCKIFCKILDEYRKKKSPVKSHFYGIDVCSDLNFLLNCQNHHLVVNALFLQFHSCLK